MKAIYLIFAALTIAAPALGNNVLQKNQQGLSGSACYIAKNYVGLAWENELVDVKRNMHFNAELPDFETVQSKVESLVATSEGVMDGHAARYLGLPGHYAISASDKYLKLNPQIPLHKLLVDFIDLNCQIELDEAN